MTDIRKGDRVKCEFVVKRVDPSDGSVQCPEGGWFAANEVTLVERPGPRLEELPDGTVVRPTHIERAAPWVKHDLRVIRINPLANGEYLISSWEYPFEVLGACPGTPAWDLWLAAGELDTDDRGEWWRTA